MGWIGGVWGKGFSGQDQNFMRYQTDVYARPKQQREKAWQA